MSISLILTFVVCFIAAYYLKNNKNKSRNGKLIAIVAIVISVIIAVNHNPNSSNASGGLFSSGPNIDTNKVADTVMSNMPKVMQGASWTNNNYAKSDIRAVMKGNTLTIGINTDGFYNYVPGLQQNDTYYTEIGMYTYIYNAKELFKEYPDLNDIRVELFGGSVDKYGKDVVVTNMALEMDRDTYNKMKWDTIETQLPFGSVDTSVFKDYYLRGN